MDVNEDLIYPDAKGPNEEKAKLGVPDRWLYCPRMGSVIADHFLPFKTPLCKLYDSQIDSQYHFHPRQVFTKQLPPGASLVLWLDLTKTNRYYSRKEVEQRGCVYKKMAMKGHGETPSVEETTEFCNVVRECLKKAPKGVVAVHCTHGFNRTGFLIAAYLANELDWAIDAAIGMFSKSRPAGIYKQQYVDVLCERYGYDEDHVQAPGRPLWETQAVDDEQVASSSTTPPSQVPQFMDGVVDGIRFVSDPTTRTLLQTKIKEMCGYHRDGFPGSQPVSMERSPERDNLRLLAHNKYMVSWKADGVRYLVLINDQDQVYAFDRDNNVFHIENVTFLHRKQPRHIKDTLVDTEVIIDKITDNDGRVVTTPRMLIYDIIKFEGEDVGACPFTTRLYCIQNELIAPRKEAIKSGRIKRNLEPLSIRAKDFWALDAVHKLFEDRFRSSVGHEIDGLIFQPVKDPYKAGRCDSVLKWKPPSHNSIDFKLQIRRKCKEGELPEYVGYLYVQHDSRPMGEMKATKSLQPFDNKIVECTMKNGKWIFMRERTDKSLPNSFNTAKAVYNSMVHPIEQAALIDFVKHHCQRSGKRPANCELEL